jgi:hypothetical protein
MEWGSTWVDGRRTDVKEGTRPAAVGMMMGMVIGGSISVVLFASTANALSFIAAGIGVALGLLAGAGAERAGDES